jgi:hypothetical protein
LLVIHPERLQLRKCMPLRDLVHGSNPNCFLLPVTLRAA